ncbi:MAG: hypothetical protein ACOH1J_09190 [Microbacteriaceae bacterium]
MLVSLLYISGTIWLGAEMRLPALFIALLVAGVLLGLLCASLVLLAAYSWIKLWGRHTHAFMGRDRRAVLIVIERPDASAWEIRDHVVSKIGVGFGRAFRDAIVPRAQNAASIRGVKIFAKAQNATVLALYMSQLERYGFRNEGGKRIEWP